MYKNDQVTRRYSEGFKLKILAELSTGNYSKRDLSRIYGLRSSTVNGWIKKYDRRESLLRKCYSRKSNGILKDEFYLDQCFFNLNHAVRATKNAIEVYNSKRLHLSLAYKTPNMVFNNVA